MVREGLKAMLWARKSDFDIVGDTANAEQAFELIHRLHPDVILLDIRLPGVSGIKNCTRCRTLSGNRVIVVTTFTDEKLVSQCIQDSGARGFIVKDIERFDLKRSIRAVARGEAAIDPKAAVAVLAQLRRSPQVEQEGASIQLSSQQIVILRMVAQGLSSREIATQLYLSENTVKGYVQEILHRLSVKNRQRKR